MATSIPPLAAGSTTGVRRRGFDDGSVGAALALTVIAVWIWLAPFKQTGSAEGRRAWRELTSSMGDAVFRAGLRVSTVSVDRFATFDDGYLAMVGAYLPALANLFSFGRPPGGSRAVDRVMLPLS